MNYKYLEIRLFFFICFMITSFESDAQELGILKYKGGGDWYSNPSALPQLIGFCNENIGTLISETPIEVDLMNDIIFDLPWIHMTGHGNVYFSGAELERLRQYLQGGGFLHIDDNYGMDPYIRPILLNLFTDAPLQELDINHPIFNQTFNFPNGLPKIHEHNNQPPQAFGITLNGRLILLYTFESDLSDGWEDPRVHQDPPHVRLKALQMGANVIQYVFNH